MDKPLWTEQTVPITELKPNPNNPRTITEEQYRKLKKSLADTGYHARLLVDKHMNVLGGHMRLRALKELGYKELPVLVANRDLTEGERHRVMVQDNIEFGEWNMDTLAAQVDVEDLLYWGMPEKMIMTAEHMPDDPEKQDGEDKEPKTCPHCGKEI